MPGSCKEALAAFGLLYGYSDSGRSLADWQLVMRAAKRIGDAAREPAFAAFMPNGEFDTLGERRKLNHVFKVSETGCNMYAWLNW